EVDAQSAGSDATAFVALLLRGAGGDVAGDQVAERRVQPFEIVVPPAIGDLPGGARVAVGRGDPDAAVVAQRLAHQGELALVLAGARNARRVDLGEAGVREVRAAPVRPPDGGCIGALGVRAQVEDVAVAAGG